MHNVEGSPLGKTSAYSDRYDPSLLYPVARAPLRRELGIGDVLPFSGCDVWNAYELSWLNGKGKPRIALAAFTVAAESPNIVESKSLKLYLNSFNQTRFPGDMEEVRQRLQEDLSKSFGSNVAVSMQVPGEVEHEAIGTLAGECIDDQDIGFDLYSPAPDLLRSGGDTVAEALHSHLLKSNCPITGQPDWASIYVRYLGPRLDREGLLRYIVSFRRHGGFHEHCVERIFMDILDRCGPEELTVYARYTRRGGLDINPFRSNCGAVPPANRRLCRQ